jgi:hypothetical protein
VGLIAFCVGATSASGAIERGAVAIGDYDGHPHWTAPKRVGENISIWCEAQGVKAVRIGVEVELDGRALGGAHSITCKPGQVPRVLESYNRIIRIRHRGTYEVHLNGHGFDDFVIGTKVVRRPSDAPSHNQTHPQPCEECAPPPRADG